MHHEAVRHLPRETNSCAEDIRLTLALQALLDEPVQQGAAVVAEGEALVGVHHEAVRHVHVEALSARHAHARLLLQEHNKH